MFLGALSDGIWRRALAWHGSKRGEKRKAGVLTSIHGACEILNEHCAAYISPLTGHYK